MFTTVNILLVVFCVALVYKVRQSRKTSDDAAQS